MSGSAEAEVKLAVVDLIAEGVTPAGRCESHAAQCAAAGATHAPCMVAASLPTRELLNVVRATGAVYSVTHVMIVSPDARLDEHRVAAAFALAKKHPDSVILAASTQLYGELLLYSGVPDESGKSDRERHGERKLSEDARESVARGEGTQNVYERIQAEVGRLNLLFGYEPKEAQAWWQVDPRDRPFSVVGSVFPRQALLDLLDWKATGACTLQGDPDQLARVFLDLRPWVPVVDRGPRRTSVWSSILDVVPSTRNVGVTYRAARGGAPVDEKPSVAILTPCYGGAHSRYVGSLLRVVKDLHDHDVSAQTILSEGESLVTRARHNLVHLFLLSRCTHMLFWDADLELADPTVVRRMLAADKAVVGGAYPFRDGSGRLVVNFLVKDAEGNDRSLETRDVEQPTDLVVDATGCAEVRHVPTGFLLVRRDVIEELYEAHPELMYVDTSFQKDMRGSPRWDVFGTALMGTNYLSEDWAFCERWRALGERITLRKSNDGLLDIKTVTNRDVCPDRYKIHVFVDAEFVHHGSSGSTGSLRAKMRKKGTTP